MNPIQVLRNDSANAVIRDDRFLNLWRGLYSQCSYATVFQDPSFVCAWYQAYSAVWQPVILHSKNLSGHLTGLWLLAQHINDKNILSHAGTHQAEYQTWLALPGEEIAFIAAAWEELKHQLGPVTLRFKYLPDGSLRDFLDAAPNVRSCLSTRWHTRPLMKLDRKSLDLKFSKKHNRSRLNQLRRCGKIEFRRIMNLEEFEKVFDVLIDYYDFRQAAVYNTTPFAQDPHKRDFHRHLLASSDKACLTITLLDGHPVAGFWGLSSGSVVHAGMLIHSPFLAKYSPAMLHVMQLSRYLLDQGKHVLDLTPGEDYWKERFANAYENVAEVVIYSSVGTRIRAEFLEKMSRLLKRFASSAGITPTLLRSAWSKIFRVRTFSTVRKITEWAYMDREFRVYRADQEVAERYGYDSRVKRNSLSDLLKVESSDAWQDREVFFSKSLARLQRGEFAYTISLENRLAHSGWMVLGKGTAYMTEVKQSITFPPRSAVFYDFHTHRRFRNLGFYRATIGHMLHDTFCLGPTDYVYIGVLAENLPAKHVIEKIGFRYEGSLYLARRFGIQRMRNDLTLTGLE